jgi:hypothetical protein
MFIDSKEFFMRGLLVLLIMVCSGSLCLGTAQQDTSAAPVSATQRIYLKGGTVLLGKIKQFGDEQIVYINEADGKEYTLPASMVDKIERAASERPAPATSSVPAVTIGAETAEPAPETAPIPEKKEPDIYKQHPERYGPFAFAKSIGFGLGCSYFYYREKFPLSDILSSYAESHTAPPSIIIGSPKSTEYGYLPSANLSFTRVFPRARLFLRPSMNIMVGYKNTYDGSSQGKTITDANGNDIGLKFTPILQYKNNAFFHGAVDVGFCNLFKKFNIAIYDGLDLKVWYRTLGETTYDDAGILYRIRESETYVSVSFPIGITAYLPLSRTCGIGANAVIDLMMYGEMDASTEILDNDGIAVSDVSITYPAVTLGNKAQYKFELFFQAWLTERLSLRVAPYALAYSFGKSNTATAKIRTNGSEYPFMTFHEPESGSVFSGINVTLGLDFKPFTLQ